MDIAHSAFLWLDAVLIEPFTWPASPVIGVWLGCAIVAVYSVMVGELTAGLLFFVHRKHYFEQQDAMVKAHNLSVQALQSGDKESYKAINRTAHEAFGKAFFAQATVGITSLWPVPFALAWLSLRFEGIPIVILPLINRPLGYPFVFLLCYIVIRVLFSRQKKRLPFFHKVHALQEQAKASRGAMRSMFRPSNSDDTERN